MASLLTHPIVPITAAALVGRSGIPLPLLALGSSGRGAASGFSSACVRSKLRQSARRFLSARGWEVLRSQLIWVWTPLLSLALLGYLVRSRFSSCASR
jgi:hypothetical protein